MKKLFLAILVLVAVSPAHAAKTYLDLQIEDAKKNPQYQAINIHEKNYNRESHLPIFDKSIKDPKLININADYKRVSDEDFKKKLAEDEKEYKKVPANMKKISAQNNVDYYEMYKIAERIIRANNLDYMNWRIAIRKTPDNVNAASTAANFIYINTALYDSLYPNEDALAFIMAHEMAHLILGHLQRDAENVARFNELTSLTKSLNRSSKTAASGAAIAAQIQLNNVVKQMQTMEYMADSEAFILLTRAGYSPDSALEALNFISALPEIAKKYDTHPLTRYRIDNAIMSIEVINPDWVEEGKANIYNSEVLKCKKSSDRVSFSILKSEKSKNFYHPETSEQRMTRMAYIYYLSNRPVSSAKYFKQLTELRKNDYIPYLYLSYANEAAYKKYKGNKFRRRAIKAIKKASILKPNDENIETQMQDLGL